MLSPRPSASAIHPDQEVPPGALALILATLEAMTGRRALHQVRPRLSERAFLELAFHAGAGVYRRMPPGRLRAQMRSSSLLTGKQYVELFLNPGSEPVLHGAPEYVLEIPTLSSGIDKITEKLESLPLEEILNKVAVSLDTLNGMISSEQTGATVESLAVSIKQLESILTGINKNLPTLLSEINQGITDFSVTMKEARGFIEGAHQELKPVSADLHKLMILIRISL